MKAETAINSLELQCMIFKAGLEALAKKRNNTDKNYGLEIKCSHQLQKEEKELLDQKLPPEDLHQLNIPIPANILRYLNEQGDICYGNDLLFHNKAQLKTDPYYPRIINSFKTSIIDQITGNEGIEFTSEGLIKIVPARDSKEKVTQTQPLLSQAQKSLTEEFVNSEDEAEDKENTPANHREAQKSVRFSRIYEQDESEKQRSEVGNTQMSVVNEESKASEKSGPRPRGRPKSKSRKPSKKNAKKQAKSQKQKNRSK